jgi:hypothetical protein
MNEENNIFLEYNDIIIYFQKFEIEKQCPNFWEWEFFKLDFNLKNN